MYLSGNYCASSAVLQVVKVFVVLIFYARFENLKISSNFAKY